MSVNTTGIIILAALSIFTLGFAALALGGLAGMRRVATILIVPAALVGALLVALLFGFRLPSHELTAAVPVGVGLLTAIGSRSLGYGLLAGLIVAAAMV